MRFPIYNPVTVLRTAATKIRDLAPRGWLDAALQFGLFFAVYNGYQVVRGLAEGREELAFANAQRIVDIEAALGTLFEPGLQEALINHARWLVDFSNFMYLNSHFVVTTGFLTWLYFRRNECFYFVRNMFMAAMVAALTLYALVPTAPPRLMDSDFGFVDTIAVYTGLPQDSDTVGLLVNQYAAIPSMHVAFALMVAVPAAALVRNPLARAWWTAYPVIVFFVIVATGNHFWLDAAAGAAVACMAAVTAKQLAKTRPSHWAWPAERARVTA